jgi:hypothetical protein
LEDRELQVGSAGRGSNTEHPNPGWKAEDPRLSSENGKPGKVATDLETLRHQAEVENYKADRPDKDG